jgi:phosphatidylserine/phosphatidylglycerophosphate/cardiolipin synthase-like enzyme
MHQKISLIVQPGDSFFPIVRAIDRAERSINLTVFRMDDPIIQRALLEARKRGVRIRVLISSSARGWEEKNQKLLKDAKKAGIATKEPAGDSKKARYHYKAMTTDDAVALVFTFNPTRENLHYTRDFGVELHSPKVASEINRLFDADWDDMPFKPDPDSPLLISPYNSRRKMMEFLGAAERSIQIADAKVEDPEVIKLLVEKAKTGVSVRVLGDEKHGGGLPKPLEFRAIPRFKLHAKCTIVDGKRAVLGSMNMRTESFDRRRELCILVEDEEILRRLNAVFKSDWEQKAPPSSSAATIVVGAVKPMPSEPAPLPAGGYVLISRTDALVRYSLRDGVTSVGRSEENDIVVADALASRHHARIALDAGGCTITDLGSGNGTFVNGEPVQGSRPLAPGDVVGIGGAEEFRLFQL